MGIHASLPIRRLTLSLIKPIKGDFFSLSKNRNFFFLFFYVFLPQIIWNFLHRYRH